MPGLAKGSYGEFKRSGFQLAGKLTPGSRLCLMGQSVCEKGMLCSLLTPRQLTQC
jgi:hypothetical protein